MKECLPTLLFVDDRPISLSAALLRRHDVQPVFLRFSDVLGDLPADYVEATRDVPTFVVDVESSLHAEVERFRRWQRGLEMKVCHFLNPSEPRQHVSHRFARALGIPALEEEQVDRLRNKVRMKDHLAALGFEIARYAVVEQVGDIITFADAYSRQWGSARHEFS